ncbi:hypothetical protein [Microbulbifer sp. SAOS-129_SWC]|uniref:hypothetical protein n=1 Tax=Microbulbifer sp. SAOS-129_SWC TaxID=3145235 RepID=UPI003216B47A
MKSKRILLAFSMSLAVLIGGCASFDGATRMDGFWCDLAGTPRYYSQRTLPLADVEAFPRQCLDGDQQVPDRNQCFSESGACYQLDGGNWCSDIASGICPLPGEPAPPPVDTDCPGGDSCPPYFTNLRCRSV